MSSLRRVITADKTGFLEHLAGIRQEHADKRILAGNRSTRSQEYQYQRGYVDGIRYAEHAVRDWKHTPDLAQLAVLLDGAADELTDHASGLSLAEEVVHRAGQRDKVAQEIRNAARLLREADVNG